MKAVKENIPDVWVEGSNEEDGDVDDSIDFVLKNFNEMNRLWVRLQYLGAANSSKEEKVRELP
jgi:hypothetical protein